MAVSPNLLDVWPDIFLCSSQEDCFGSEAQSLIWLLSLYTVSHRNSEIQRSVKTQPWPKAELWTVSQTMSDVMAICAVKASCGQEVDPVIISKMISDVMVVSIYSSATGSLQQNITNVFKGPLSYCFSSIYHRSQIYTEHVSDWLKHQNRSLQHYP